MDVEEQIRTLRDFLEQNYHPQLLEGVRKGLSFLTVDFAELIKFNLELSEEFLENPVELLKAAELAVKEFDLPTKIAKFNIRFTNLPDSVRVSVSDIRSKHLNKFVKIEGVVRQKTDVRPHVTASKFECPSCGNILTILQLDKKYKEPSRCGCGRKGKFKEISKELVDGQGLVLEEAPDELDGSQPRRINVFLKDDLVSPISERRSSPGSRVRVYGWATEVPITLKSGGQATKYDLIIEANLVEPLQEDQIETNLSPEELQKIEEIGRHPNVVKLLADNVAPSIYGHDKIKEALVLQLAGGSRKIRPDGMVTRGDMHILLIGDPGSAKSQLLKRISRVGPKARFTSGKGATAAGLCIAPDSLVLTNPGLQKIGPLVEEALYQNTALHEEGIWKAAQPPLKKVLTLDEHWQVQTAPAEQFWKLKAPPAMITIITGSGKKIEITPNTKLLTAEEGEPVWKESAELRTGQHIAAIRKATVKSPQQILTLPLVRSNPVIYGAKKAVAEMVKLLAVKYGIKRKAAQHLGWNENNMYHNWVQESARGNPHLYTLRKMVEETKYPVEKVAQEITGFSLYKGKKITLPLYFNADLLYFAGLIAGDGDLSKGKNAVSIRFFNSSEELIQKFQQLSNDLFGVRCNYSSRQSPLRPTSVRFSSIIVAEILHSLGIPLSPKSHKIDLSDTLVQLPNHLLKSYLQGLFDADGSAIERREGCSYVDVTTTSESLARKLPLVLLRFGVLAKVRRRKVGGAIITPPRTIIPHHDKYIIEIKSKANLEQFEREIGFGYIKYFYTLIWSG